MLGPTSSRAQVITALLAELSRRQNPRPSAKEAHLYHTDATGSKRAPDSQTSERN